MNLSISSSGLSSLVSSPIKNDSAVSISSEVVHFAVDQCHLFDIFPDHLASSRLFPLSMYTGKY